jgi:superfamily II DNA/RNA helicase
MTDFTIFNVPEFLLNSLGAMGIKSPTPIQSQAIPIALSGKDLLASAQTGTGKTIAYLVPIISHLASTQNTKGIILAPTRELATQIKEAAHKLLNGVKGLHSALLIGGEQMFKQLDQLKRAPRLIIGTPGRINDHLNRGSLKLKDTSFLVLDETDRMLDMGFSEQLDEIKTYITNEHQTLMFSATLPHNILNLSKKYLNNPERIAVGPENTVSVKIKQDTIQTSENDKFGHLIRELAERTGSVIIFVKTKRGADNLAAMLREQSHKVNAIHGDLQQSKRDRVILGFREGKYRILVATDVAARGLDVPHIEHVINFDLPMQAEDYIHRIGRTGRAGAEGQALSFISPDDQRKWRMISQLIDPTAKPLIQNRSPYGRKPGSSSYSGGNAGGRRSSSSSSFGRTSYSAKPEGQSNSRVDGRFSPSPRSNDGDFGGRRSYADKPGRKAGPRSEGPFRSSSNQDNRGRFSSYQDY